MQTQSSSPYIPFALEDYLKEEVTSAPQDDFAQPIPESIKAQLQLLIPHLETDTAMLVKDAGTIRGIFNPIKDALTPQLREILQPVAFIECHEPKFSRAQTRLSVREARKNLPAQE